MSLIANVALTDTFDVWRTRTNQLIVQGDVTYNFANAAYKQANSIAIGANAWTNTVAVGANAWSNTKVSSVTGTAGQIYSSGGTTPIINLISTAVSADTYGGASQIPVLTVDAFGRLTAASNVAVQGMDYVYANTIGAASNGWTNTAVAGANAWTNTVVAAANSWANTIAAGANAWANTIAAGANAWSNTKLSNTTTTLAGDLTITGNTYVAISTSKRVGIATASPAATLDVVGSVSHARANVLSQTLTDSATVSWDTSLGQIATVTLGGNRIMGAPTNLRIGTYILNVIQDGSGSKTLTWNSVFKWPAGVAPTLTTTASARDVMSFFSDGTNLYGTYINDVK